MNTRKNQKREVVNRIDNNRSDMSKNAIKSKEYKPGIQV